MSQVEQRLNAIDRHVRKNAQRIYDFRIADADRGAIRREGARGILIARNLTADDLFSLAIAGNVRVNFERCFSQYEQNYGANVELLLSACEAESSATPDIGDALTDILALKLLGLIRNPYFAPLVSGVADSYRPTDASLLSDYQEIRHCTPPMHPQSFGLSNDAYRSWLRMLFLYFRVELDGHPLFHYLVKDLLAACRIELATYTTPGTFCLLPDRTPFLWEENHLFIAANLTSRAFLQCLFWPQSRLPTGLFRALGSRAQIYIEISQNDADRLERFNRWAIRHSSCKVYCASESPFGVHVQ